MFESLGDEPPSGSAVSLGFKVDGAARTSSADGNSTKSSDTGSGASSSDGACAVVALPRPHFGHVRSAKLTRAPHTQLQPGFKASAAPVPAAIGASQIGH